MKPISIFFHKYKKVAMVVSSLEVANKSYNSGMDRINFVFRLRLGWVQFHLESAKIRVEYGVDGSGQHGVRSIVSVWFGSGKFG